MPLPDNVEQLDRQLMREEVYATLRAWIIEGRLAPGQQVRDVDLAEQLGISRTPAREALRRLEDEGLIETAAHRWTRIAPLELRQGDDVYPVVWALEGLAVRLLPHAMERDALDAMAAANERLGRALEQEDAVAAAAADEDFHGVLVSAARNDELAAVLTELKAKLRRLEIAYFDTRTVASASVSEHQRIMRALEADDRDEAVAAVETNWRNSLERLHADRGGAGG